MHARPPGPEDANGLSNTASATLEGGATGHGATGPARPSDQSDALPGRSDLSNLAVLSTESFQGGRSSLGRYLVVGDVLALLVTWLPLALLTMDDSDGRRLIAAAAAMVSTLIAMQQAGLYRSHVCALHSRQSARAVISAAIGAGVFAACEGLTGRVTPGVPLAGAIISAVLILGLRWRFSRWLKARRSSGQYLRRVLLVGTTDDAVALWDMLAGEPELGYQIVGVVGEARHQAPWQGLPTAHDPGQMAELASRVGAGGIVLAGALPSSSADAAVRGALAADLDVQIWPGLTGLSSRRIQFAPVSGIPVFHVAPQAVPKWQVAAKRAIDIAGTIALTPLVAPILLMAAIAIKLEDGGPVIYRHSVIGRYGRPTTVLKLRTMVPNAATMMADVAALNERTGGPLFKATHDPRVTKIGALLRASSVDELPQLWNVLTGRMSLVGPRFALPHEDAHFDEDLRRRHEMRPGMTGLWQTEARDNPSFSAYRRLDLLYIDNWSLGLDLAILINTAHAVIARALRLVVRTARHQPAGYEPPAPMLALPSEEPSPTLIPSPRSVHELAAEQVISG
jgi:exopolysaccharide biosynthesis polyprenyl glycosylphosphotransferase